MYSINEEKIYEEKIGTIPLGDKILLTDPCYEYSRFDSSMVCRKCVPGEWNVTYLYTVKNVWTGHYIPFAITAVAPQYDPSDIWKSVWHRLSVDSACVGIFDATTYPLISNQTSRTQHCWPSAKSKRPAYDSDKSAALQSGFGYGIIKEGVLSYTRYGDGEVDAVLEMNSKRQAVKATILLGTRKHNWLTMEQHS